MLNDGYIHTINTMYSKTMIAIKAIKRELNHICGACTGDHTKKENNCLHGACTGDYAKREDNCIHRACTEDTSEAQTNIKHMLKVTMFKMNKWNHHSSKLTAAVPARTVMVPNRE